MFKKIYLTVFVLFSFSLLAEEFVEPMRSNPDRDFDLKVDSGEIKIWTGHVSYYFNQGYSATYMGVPLRKFVESFDENKDGRFSNLEFRRFQTGSKKLFSEASAFLAEKYDENKNRRMDKAEREVARTEIKSFLDFSLALFKAKSNGEDAKTVLEKDRALDDIYD